MFDSFLYVYQRVQVDTNGWHQEKVGLYTSISTFNDHLAKTASKWKPSKLSEILKSLAKFEYDALT